VEDDRSPSFASHVAIPLKLRACTIHRVTPVLSKEVPSYTYLPNRGASFQHVGQELGCGMAHMELQSYDIGDSSHAICLDPVTNPHSPVSLPQAYSHNSPKFPLDRT